MPGTPAAAIGRYSAADVARLAGVTPQKIGAWARYGIVPSVSSTPRVYSYADAGEAVLVRYLVAQRVTTAGVRDIVLGLREEFGAWPLANAPLEHEGRMVVRRDKDGRTLFDAVSPGQEVMAETLLDLKSVRGALRSGGWVAHEHGIQHVQVDPELIGGTTAVEGHRLSTEFVARLAGSDEGREILADEYELTADEVASAVRYEQAVAEAMAA